MKKGFTLIELLVVVAIIGILATIVIINVTSARDKAKKATVESNVATVAKLMNSCKALGGTVHDQAFYLNGLNNGDLGFSPNSLIYANGDALPVCDTSGISDPNDKQIAAGNFPTLPANYSYYECLPVPQYPVSSPMVSVCGPGGDDGPNVYSCGVSGCGGTKKIEGSTSAW